MSTDENSNTTPTEEQLEAARQILKSAGLKILTDDQLKDRLARATRDVDPLKTQNQELAEQLRDAQKKLQVYEDKGRSAEEKIAAEIEAHKRQAEAWQKRYEDEQRKAERERNARKAEYVQTQLHDLLPDDATVPERVLVRELLAQHPGFLAEDTTDGQFRLAYTSPDSIPGDPGETVADWYKQQTWAHKPSGERVPTNGAPPPGSAKEKSLFEMTGPEAAEYVFEQQLKGR